MLPLCSSFQKVIALTLACFALSGCSAASTYRAVGLGAQVPPDFLPSSDISGKPLPHGKVATVYYFAGPDCPIARAYSPEVSRLSQRDAGRSIAWIMGFPESGITPQVVRDYQTEYAVDIPAVVDGSAELCCRMGVIAIPSVVVLDSTDRIVYRGRLDNRYQGLGISYGPPTRRDLDEVLEALESGREFEPTATSAVGCVLQPCGK